MMPLRSIWLVAVPIMVPPVAWLLVAGELAVVAPVRFLGGLGLIKKIISGDIADPDHGVGDGGDQLALLLIGAAGVPLDRDVGHESLLGLLESLHVIGEIGTECVRLDGPVRIEADGQVLADLAAGFPLAVEPSPHLIAAVEADLVRRAEHALE